MKNLHIASLLLAVSAIACTPTHTIEVCNSSDIDRNGQLAEVPVRDIVAVMGNQQFVITDSDGTEVPYQITHDSLLVFPTTVAANSTTTYQLRPGTPAPVDTIACGAFYAPRKDDFAWENDRSAYRAYGPALQATGEKAFGYDIWTKSVAHPVVAKRYHDAFAKISSFHEDNGDGMDVYAVGPTLGAGTAALLDAEGNIIFPWCYEKYEILDNGPLRFSVALTYPETEANGSKIRETRVITLDAGEFLNKTAVTYAGLDSISTVAPGIVVHTNNPDGYVLDPERSIMAYADLTDHPDDQNGVIYVGVVAPAADSVANESFEQPQGNAAGHLLAKSSYKPGDTYIYYWGSGWSKGFMPDWESWIQYLNDFSNRLKSPLKITIK